MGIIAETPTWEPTIYSLETTDPVEGGVTGISNKSRVELANRTAQIKEVLTKHGIEVDPASAIGFTGQWVDVDPTFEGSVINSDVVYYNIGNVRYEKALADGTTKQHFVGVADITNNKVIGGGFLGSPVIVGVPVQGNTIYLSDTLPGVMTTTASSVAVGKWLFTGTMMLNAGVGGSGGAGGSYLHEQDSYRMLLDSSYYKNAFFDQLLDDIFVGHNMTFDFGSNKLEFTAGQQVTSAGNIKDPLVALTIDEAFLSVDMDDTGATLFYMSADGGANWEAVSNNAIHIFANTGSDLRMSIIGGGTGEIRSYAVMYNPESQLRPISLTSIPSGEILLFESDVAVAGYTLLVDQDDQLVYISSGGAAGMKPGSTWTQPLHDHDFDISAHNHPIGSHTHPFIYGNQQVNANPGTGPAHIKDQGGFLVTHHEITGSSASIQAMKDGTGAASGNTGDRTITGETTDLDGTLNTYRPRGRNFTRQQKL